MGCRFSRLILPNRKHSAGGYAQPSTTAAILASENALESIIENSMSSRSYNKRYFSKIPSRHKPKNVLSTYDHSRIFDSFICPKHVDYDQLAIFILCTCKENETIRRALQSKAGNIIIDEHRTLSVVDCRYQRSLAKNKS